MENFELQYPVEGANALDPRCEEVPARCGTIIAFPGQKNLGEPAGPSCISGPKHARFEEDLGETASFKDVWPCVSPVRHAWNRLMQTDLVANLRYGSAQGVAFGCAERWQAVVAGCVFAALAFATLFVGI